MSEIVLISKYSSEAARRAAIAVQDFNAGIKRLGQAASEALVVIQMAQAELKRAISQMGSVTK